MIYFKNLHFYEIEIIRAQPVFEEIFEKYFQNMKIRMYSIYKINLILSHNQSKHI